MLRVATVTAAALLALLVSCFSKPGAPHAGDGGGSALDDARRDGMGVDAGNCLTVHDDFETPGSPCGTWGTAMNSGYLNRTGGKLHMVPAMPMQASCFSVPFKFEAGASLQIADPLIDNMGDHTFFKISSSGSGGQYVQINMYNSGTGSGGGGQVQALCSGAATSTPQPYSSMTHQWWKFEPGPSNGTVQIFSGSDGTTWTPFLGQPTCNWGVSPGTMVNAEFGGALGVTIGGVGDFDNFNIKTCPPP